MKRIAFWLENLLQRGLHHGGELVGLIRAHLQPHLRLERGGQRCHCPPLLARDAARHLVHSEGIREACDFVIDWDSNVENRSRRQVPTRHLGPGLARLPAGASVHVKTQELDAFKRDVLPHATAPIVLVTGDADIPPVARHRELLEHPMIAHWYAQNADLAHPRLTPIPIGFDNPVYTKLEKRLGFLLTMLLRRTPFDPTVTRNDMGDQALLWRIRPTLPRDRPLRVLCTFTRNGKLVANYEQIPDRVEAARHLRDIGWFPPRRLRQEECWRLHGDFAFEVCPRGKGMDTFRIWEALFLGTIPIVKTSPLDALYRPLPVVIVEDYREITPARLAAWRDTHAPPAALLPQLTNDYWVQMIRTHRFQSTSP